MKEQLSIDQQVITAVFSKYVQAKRILENSNFMQNGVLKETLVGYANQQVSPTDFQNYQKHVQIVDTVLALLPKNEYSYIIRTFLVKSHKNWWKKHYQQAEFKKLQAVSIKRFLYLYLI